MNKKSVFPPVHHADDYGLLAVTPMMTLDLLLDAYAHGIFPWPVSHSELIPWFSPDPRGVLPTSEFRVNRSLKKALNKHRYHFEFNRDFERIMRECSNNDNRSSDNNETWITEEMILAYTALHYQQKAYSLGCYLDDQLVAGVYGVCLGGLVSAESMFSKRSNASKVTLHHLCQVAEQANIPYLDTQMVTPVVESLGGKEIPRTDFLANIPSLLAQKAVF